MLRYSRNLEVERRTDHMIERKRRVRVKINDRTYVRRREVVKDLDSVKDSCVPLYAGTHAIVLYP